MKSWFSRTCKLEFVSAPRLAKTHKSKCRVRVIKIEIGIFCDPMGSETQSKCGVRVGVYGRTSAFGAVGVAKHVAGGTVCYVSRKRFLQNLFTQEQLDTKYCATNLHYQDSKLLLKTTFPSSLSNDSMVTSWRI